MLANVDKISGAKRKENLTRPRGGRADLEAAGHRDPRRAESEIDLDALLAREPDRARLREVFREFELAPGWPTPAALGKPALGALKRAWVKAAKRASRIGLDFIELHSTHGYLLSEFLSPLSNHRTDEYGGSLENRMRFPLEVFTALREAWGLEKPIGAKISGTDFSPGGWTRQARWHAPPHSAGKPQFAV